MKIKESTTIDRSIEIVWEHIQDPMNMRKWNPRVKSMRPLPQIMPGLGYKFDTVYEMFGWKDHFTSEIVEFYKPHRLSIKYISPKGKPKGYIIERFELKVTRSGTKLRHFLDFKKSRINIFLKILLYFLGILGRPIGKRYLSKLKEAVEC